jgi:hypothetical protein
MLLILGTAAQQRRNKQQKIVFMLAREMPLLLGLHLHAAAGPLLLRWYGNTKGRQMVVMIQTQKCATNSIAFLPASSRVSSTRISDLTAGANDSILSYVSMERRKFLFSQSQWSHFSRTKF